MSIVFVAGRTSVFKQKLSHSIGSGQYRAFFGDNTIFDGSTPEKMPANRIYFKRGFNSVFPGRWASAVVLISRATAWSGGSSSGVRVALASVLPNSNKAPNARLGAAGEHTGTKTAHTNFRVAFPSKVWVPYGDFLIALQFDGFSAGSSQTVFNPDIEIYTSSIAANFFSKTNSEGGADYSYAGGIPATFAPDPTKYTQGSGACPADMFAVVEWAQ